MKKAHASRKWVTGLTGGALTSAFLLAAGAAPAHADSAPQAPETLSTVTADSLPTMQVNGVVWDQVVVGNTVYAVGQFDRARPAGAAAGTNETTVANAVAYDITTGVMKSGWLPKFNGVARTVTAAADGSAVYIGGDFTSVTGPNGTYTRSRIVSVNPTTGAVNGGFTANTNSRVNTLEVSGSTLYAGGEFTVVNNTGRQRLAAMSISTGALTSWAPDADSTIYGIAIPQGTNSVIVGGRLENLNGVQARGMGAVDIATGKTTLPWAINSVIQNYGPNSAIWSLTTNGNLVFGTAYDYNGPSPFEATFAANASDGSMVWVSGAKGDTYDAVAINDVVYDVSHSHNSAPIGGHPQTDPWTYQRAQAYSLAADGVNNGGSFNGSPKPRLLHWQPTLVSGSYTGQGQAAWTIEGNNDYVVAGGEMPKVNGTAQQGLARFAVSSKAPNTEGPQGITQLKPTVISLAPGTVRVSWQAAWDRDNRTLTYKVLRGANTSTAKVVATITADSSWWNRPFLAVTDTSATPGATETYRVRVTDPFNNSWPVNVKPTAVFDATVTDLKVSVDAKDSTDSDGTLESYAWDFGDGATGTGVTADHTYTQAGTYTVTLIVTDDNGASSATTHQVTPRTVPGAPTGVKAVAGNGSATISWTAPGNGGAAITKYTVTSPGGKSWTTSGTSMTVTGLTNGVGHTFTVQASNAVGTGAASAPATVIPRIPVKVSAVKAGYGNVLAVNVSPVKSPGSYTLKVQKKTSTGWTNVTSTQSTGATRNLTLGAGTFRVYVPASGAYGSAYSPEVKLTVPTVKVKATTDAAKNKITVNVNPDKGSGYWTFKVQQRRSNGTWATLSTTYKTQGRGETATINKGKGTYRIVVAGKYGYLGAASNAVTLTR